MALFTAKGSRCAFQEGRWDGDVKEKADAEGMMKVVYNNPLDIWRNKVMELPYPTLVARRVLAIRARRPSLTQGFDFRTHCEQKAW